MDLKGLAWTVTGFERWMQTFRNAFNFIITTDYIKCKWFWQVWSWLWTGGVWMVYLSVFHSNVGVITNSLQFLNKCSPLGLWTNFSTAKQENGTTQAEKSWFRRLVSLDTSTTYHTASEIPVYHFFFIVKLPKGISIKGLLFSRGGGS